MLDAHDQEEALSVADTVAVMSDGRIVQHDRPARVYSEPASLESDAVGLSGHGTG